VEVPTGCQDYYPAMYGGVSAVELRVDGIRRVALLQIEPRGFDCADGVGVYGRAEFGDQQLGGDQAAH
jgi:hypothetical protein